MLDLEEENYDDDDYTPDSTPSSSSSPPLQATNAMSTAASASSAAVSVQAQLQRVGGQVITQTTVRQHKPDSGRIGQHLVGGVQFSEQASSSRLNNQFILPTTSHQADSVSALGYNRMIEVPAQQQQQVSGHVQLQQVHALRMGMVDQQQQQQHPWTASVEQVAIQVQKTQLPMSHNERLKFSSSTPPSQESRSAHLHHRLSDASSVPQPDCFKMRGGALSNSIRRRLPQHPTSKALQQQQQQQQAGRQTNYQQQLDQSPLHSRQTSVTGLEPGTSFEHSTTAVVVCPRPVSPSPSSMFLTTKLASMTIGANGQLEQRTTLTQQQQEQVVLEHEQNYEHHQHHQMMSNLFNENQQQQMQLINQVETNQIDRYRRSAAADNSLAQQQQQQQQLHSPIPANHRPSYSTSPASGLHSSVDKMLLMRDIQSVVVSDHHPLERQASSGGARNRGSAVTVAAQAGATVTVAQPTTTPTKSATAASPLIRSTIDEDYLSGSAAAFRNQQSSDEQQQQLMILLGPKQRNTTSELDDIEQKQQALLGQTARRETGTTLVNSGDVYNNARQIHSTQQHISGHRSSGDTSASGEHQAELMYELRRDSDASNILLPLLPKATQQGATFAELPISRRTSNFTNDHLLYAQDHHYDEQQLQHYDRLG